MSVPAIDVLKLVSTARAAVSEARARIHLARAWDALQERDAEGQPRGARPYADEALAELLQAHAHDPEDIGVVHHLAIAYHARAWDWELAGDTRATDEWERALNHWHTVVVTREFWGGLKEKLRSCDDSADPQLLTEVRASLLEHLLDVHVDFVRHYCESTAPDRANAHVEIVRRARIPPAVKKRLVEKVYEAMTGGVSEARARQEHASALGTLERFLALFPNHLPALRQHAEATREWLACLSYLDDWDEVLAVSARAEPHARRLASHAELSSAPLAQAALEELAFELLLKGDDRHDSCAAESAAGGGALRRDEARTVCEFGLRWGRLAFPISLADSRIKKLAARSMNSLALSLYEEWEEVAESDTDYNTKLVAMIDLLRPATTLAEEALTCDPRNEAITHNVKLFQDILTKLEAEKTELDLFR